MSLGNRRRQALVPAAVGPGGRQLADRQELARKVAETHTGEAAKQASSLADELGLVGRRQGAGRVGVRLLPRDKYYGVWFMWTQFGLEPRVIAAQAGWDIKGVEKLLKIYGHGKVGALAEVDAAFAKTRPNTAPGLRAIEGGKVG